MHRWKRGPAPAGGLQPGLKARAAVCSAGEAAHQRGALIIVANWRAKMERSFSFTPPKTNTLFLLLIDEGNLGRPRGGQHAPPSPRTFLTLTGGSPAPGGALPACARSASDVPFINLPSWPRTCIEFGMFYLRQWFRLQAHTPAQPPCQGQLMDRREPTSKLTLTVAGPQRAAFSPGQHLLRSSGFMARNASS